MPDDNEEFNDSKIEILYGSEIELLSTEDIENSDSEYLNSLAILSNGNYIINEERIKNGLHLRLVT